MPSSALDRPRPQPRRPRHPHRWGVQVNEQNRPVLIQMITLLVRVESVYEEEPDRRKHLEAVRVSLTLLRNLVDANPREIVLDPDDFLKRSVLLYLDETCWGLILRMQQQQAQMHPATAGYASYY